MNTTQFVNRHISLNENDTREMLDKVGVPDIQELVNQTIPSTIRLEKDIEISQPLSEYEMLLHSKELASKNALYDTYIGFGYYGTILPSAIQRNILENAGWYTAYTPYQAEIAQGRLEALLNYQTAISDLTGLPWQMHPYWTRVQLLLRLCICFLQVEQKTKRKIMLINFSFRN